jgi:hypothetical protein
VIAGVGSPSRPSCSACPSCPTRPKERNVSHRSGDRIRQTLSGLNAFGSGPLDMIPLELMHEIIGHLSADVDAETLRACALVSLTWLHPARLRLFKQVTLDSVESWRNLSDLLARTPHLSSYVHRLVISNDMLELRGFLHHSVRDEADPDARTCLGRQLSGVQELHLRCIPFRFRHEIARFFESHFLEVVSLRMKTADIVTSAQLQQCYLAPRRALRSLCLQGVMVFDKDIRLCLAGYDSLTVDGLALSIPSDLAMPSSLTPDSQNTSLRYLDASSIDPGSTALLANCIHRVATSLEIVTVTTVWPVLSRMNQGNVIETSYAFHAS